MRVAGITTATVLMQKTSWSMLDADAAKSFCIVRVHLEDKVNVNGGKWMSSACAPRSTTSNSR